MKRMKTEQRPFRVRHEFCQKTDDDDDDDDEDNGGGGGGGDESTYGDETAHDAADSLTLSITRSVQHQVVRIYRRFTAHRSVILARRRILDFRRPADCEMRDRPCSDHGRFVFQFFTVFYSCRAIEKYGTATATDRTRTGPKRVKQTGNERERKKKEEEPNQFYHEFMTIVLSTVVFMVDTITTLCTTRRLREYSVAAASRDVHENDITRYRIALSLVFSRLL